MSTHTEDTKNWWLSKFTKGLPTIITSSKTGETELHPEFVEALTAYASQVREERDREILEALKTQAQQCLPEELEGARMSYNRLGLETITRVIKSLTQKT